MTFAEIEEALGLPRATVCRHMKRNKWRIVGKSTRPALSDAMREARYEWAQNNVGNPWVEHVDLDEKWFYVYTHTGKLKLPPGAEKPKQRLCSKRYFIGKVMLLCAIARPDARHNFDGLVGAWRVCEQVPARHGDRRTGLKKGEMRTIDVAMDANKFESMMRNLVIPAIRDKLKNAKTITVQMDNATPHKSKSKDKNDTMEKRLQDVLKAPRLRGKQHGPDIVFLRQVPNSPDTNACDLGFFKSIDSRLPKRRDFNLDRFTQQCLESFRAYPPEKLNALFDTKSRVLLSIVEAEGGNDYALPHRRDVVSDSE
mmetsp:Transcript_31106/g.95180  ORF Transcript_31106/g.95180 Transcript_31106/m.95180 type:complete len:312 (-) Transcript_31106:201-1136(-)